jgi:hypothetical protein
MLLVTRKRIMTGLFLCTVLAFITPAHANIFMNQLGQTIKICENSGGRCASIADGECVGITGKPGDYNVTFFVDGTVNHPGKSLPTGVLPKDLIGYGGNQVKVTANYHLASHNFGVIMASSTAIFFKINDKLGQKNCYKKTYTGL